MYIYLAITGLCGYIYGYDLVALSVRPKGKAAPGSCKYEVISSLCINKAMGGLSIYKAIGGHRGLSIYYKAMTLSPCPLQPNLKAALGPDTYKAMSVQSSRM